MKKRILPLLAGTFLLALVSCSDTDELTKNDVVFPPGTVENVLTVDAWYSEYQINIKGESAWHIETENRFLRVTPDKGTGDATVTLHVQDNQGEERKGGVLNIIFDNNPKQNRQLIIEQKFAGDYSENAADKIGTSNKIYAVGYGYDATGEWASPNSVKMQIFNTRQLMEAGQLAVGPTQAGLVLDMITGSSISEMTNSLATKVSVRGGFGKFKAEASTSFDMSHAKNTNYEYASAYVNLDVRNASLEPDLATLCLDYMTDDAWYAINGVPRKDSRTGRLRLAYPSDDEGFVKLLKAVGTHVVLNSRLGGRVRHTMEVDISKVTSSYDIRAFAGASYKGWFTGGGFEVDEKFEKSYQENKSNTSIRVSVLGGDESLAKKLGSASGLTKENLDAWVQSVTEDNMALVGFNDNSLEPIYELIDETFDSTFVDSKTGKTYHVNGADRKKRLKEFMNGDKIGATPDFSTYDCGTVTKFKVPIPDDFVESGVHTVSIGGQEVAYICKEYIPNINKSDRVIVIYPLINNKPRFNMGFFIGNDTHKPARVAWDGTNVAVQDYSDLGFGSVDSLYLRGASISVTPPDGTTSMKGNVNPTLLTDMDNNSYPLVKIFDHIWMADDYKGITSRNAGGDKLNGTGTRPDYMKDGNGTYYDQVAVNKSWFPPTGWRVPTQADYKAIESKLISNNMQNLGKAFWQGGVLGYNAYREGYGYEDKSDNRKYKLNTIKGQVDHRTKDNGHVRIQKGGSFVVEGYGDGPMHVRLIME